MFKDTLNSVFSKFNTAREIITNPIQGAAKALAGNRELIDAGKKMVTGGYINKNIKEGFQKDYSSFKQAIQEKSFAPVKSRLISSVQESNKDIAQNPEHYVDVLSIRKAQPLLKAVPKPPVIDKVIKLLKDAKPVRNETERLYTAERARRASAGAEAVASTSGEQSYYAGLSKLKGELPKAKYDSVRADVVPNRMVQTVDPTTGEKEFFTIPKDKADEIINSIDNQRNAAGKGGIAGVPQADGKIYHVTAKTPEQMLEQQFSYKGVYGSNKLIQSEVDELFDMVRSNPKVDFYDKITAFNGLSKMLGDTGGSIPTDSELKTLKNIFGSDFTDAVLNKRSGWEKAKETIGDVINIPRTLMSSIDMSAPLRQGLVLSVSHPKRAASGFVDMIQYFGSDKIFKGAMESIQSRPTAKLMKESNLYFADVSDSAMSLSSKEESFMSNFAANIPGIGKLVKGSERAYAGFLNKLRADVFDDIAGEYIKGGIDPASRPEVFSSLAEFINVSTGRGNLGPFAGAAPILNGVFFSPRFMASRVQMFNPAWYAKMPPEVRKEAAKTFVKFVGTGLGILTLAKMGGADVETDPRSSDFGKIRIGNKRYDTWAGFQQWTRFTAQMITGQTKSSTSGEVSELDGEGFGGETRLDRAATFMRGKLAPVPGLVADILDGQTMIGEPVDESLADKVMPIYVQDIIEAVREEGISAVATVGVPAFFGVGTQVYGDNGTLPKLPKLPKLEKLPTLQTSR